MAYPCRKLQYDIAGWYIFVHVFGSMQLILDLVMPKFTVRRTLSKTSRRCCCLHWEVSKDFSLFGCGGFSMVEPFFCVQDRFLEWEKDVSHLDFSHCKGWLFAISLMNNMWHDAFRSCKVKIFCNRGCISTSHFSYHMMCMVPPGSPRSFLQSKSSSNRSFAHGVLLGGKVGGPIDRRSWTSLIIHYPIIIQQWHGSNIGNP